MITIFWSPLSFCVIRVLPKGAHFDATYFRDNILDEINCIGPTGNAEDHRRSLVLLFDNTKQHIARCIHVYFCENGMTRVLHPAFLPDLAPSDFYLFGKLKNVMKGYAFENENKLSLGIMSEVSKISCEELEAAFDKWLLRLDRCININGEYVD
jgi:hypothetical protein